jgi:hypothetical protein
MRNIRIFCAAVVAVVAAAACGASRTAAQRGASCPLTQRDSAYLAGGYVYRDCAVSVKAKLIPGSQRVDYRPTRVGNACYSAELEFVVDTLGKVETPTVQIVRTTDRAFAEAVMANAPTWRYEPARLDGKLVRQIVLEKSAMATGVVVVPAGQSPPPPGARAGARRPTC